MHYITEQKKEQEALSKRETIQRKVIKQAKATQKMPSRIRSKQGTMPDHPKDVLRLPSSF
jgi:hypothetical protein